MNPCRLGRKIVVDSINGTERVATTRLLLSKALIDDAFEVSDLGEIVVGYVLDIGHVVIADSLNLGDDSSIFVLQLVEG